MEKKWAFALFLLPFLFIGFVCQATAADIIVRAGLTDPLDTTFGKAMVEFKRVAEAESKGRIEVQLFPSRQLGSIVEQLENVRQGAQEMSMASPGWFSQFYPRIDMLEMPFLVTDWDQVERMLNSQAFHDLVKKAEDATNIRIYGSFPYGFRHVINSKRPVETLADLKGLKLRLQNSPAHLATFRALGANPVALAWDETYQAVQTGVVDGLENASTVLYANKYPEIAKYISLTRHLFGMLFAFINPEFYNGLGTEDRTALDHGMKAGEAMCVKLSREAEDSAIKGLRELGAQINDLSPETLKAMREAVQPVYDKMGPKFEPELSGLLKAAQGN